MQSTLKKMKMKTSKIIFNVLLAGLAIHLFYSNTDLLVSAQKLILETNLNFYEKLWKAIFALSYSVITITILYLYPKMWLIVWVAFLDGFGIYLKYNVYQNYYILFTSVYFGLYTFTIVVSSGLIRSKQLINNELNTYNHTKFVNNSVNIENEIKEIVNEKNETNNEILIRLKKQKIKVQNSINRLRNEQTKNERKNELKKIEKEILSIEN